MRSLLALAICAWAVAAVLSSAKVELPVGVLYRNGEEEDIVKSVKNVFSRERHENFSFKVVEQRYGLSTQIDRKVCALLGRGIAVLITSLPYARHSNLLLSASNRYHLPVINLSGSEYGREKSHFDLSMTMSTLKASVDIISFYGWKSAVYVRDRADESGGLSSFLRGGNSYRLTLDSVIDGDSEKTILESMEGVTKNFDGELNVILDVPLISVYGILPTLLAEYNERIVHFLITPPVPEGFWKRAFLKNTKSKVTAFSMIDGGDSVLRLRRFVGRRSDESLLAHDASRLVRHAVNRLYHENATRVAEIARNNTRRLSNCRVFPPVPWIHGLTVARALKEVKNCHGYTGNIQFDSGGRRRIFTLHVFETSPRETVKIGRWSDKTGFILEDVVTTTPGKFARVIPERKENGNKKLVITSILMEPYLMKKGDSYFGYCKDIIDILSEKMNFEYGIRIVRDGQFGTFNGSNKKWTGMIGEIISKKADLAVAPLTITSDRSGVVTFTSPIQYGGITLLVKKTYPAPSFLLFRPFGWEVWIFILIVYAIFGLFLFSFEYFISESLQKLQFIYQKQCYSPVPQKSQRRRSWTTFVGKLICSIFTLAVLCLYVAKLSAIMSSRESDGSPYQSLFTRQIFQESIRTGTPKMIMLRGGTTMKFFQKNRHAFYSQYWERVKDDPSLLVESYSDALERVLNSNGDIVLLLESPLANYVSEINCHSFTSSMGILNTQKYGMAVPSDSPLKLLLDEQILALREDGTLDRLGDKWWKDNSQCYTSRDTGTYDRPTVPKANEEALRFRDICGLFYLMIFGLAVVAVISLCQFLRRKRHRKTPRKSDIVTRRREEEEAVEERDFV